MRKRKTDPLDAAIETAWYREANRVQVSILDIPRIFAYVRSELAAGAELNHAVRDAAAKFGRVAS